MTIVGEEVRRARESASLSQRALARRLGKANSHISKIEAGLRRVDVLELLSISTATGVAASVLVSRITLRAMTQRQLAQENSVEEGVLAFRCEPA